MHIGLLSFPTDESMPILDLATEAEARGVESLFVFSGEDTPERVPRG